MALLVAFFLVTPTRSLTEVQKRYGPLDSNYRMVNHSEWIVPYDFKYFGLPYKGWINKDMTLPLTLVLFELRNKGLIHEITDFKGCHA